MMHIHVIDVVTHLITRTVAADRVKVSVHCLADGLLAARKGVVETHIRLESAAHGGVCDRLGVSRDVLARPWQAVSCLRAV